MVERATVQQTSDGIYAAWNAHDPAAVASFYNEGAEVIDSSGIATRGRTALLALWAGRLTGFPDLRLHRTTLVVEANTSADSWRLHATHTGDYDGLPPSGRGVEIVGASFTEYDEQGLVVRDTVFSNVLALLSHLGVE